MKKITVHSKLCDYEHSVLVAREGRELVVTISSDCPHVQALNGLTVPMGDLGLIKDNAILARAQDAGCSATCLVPCAIMNACWLEVGMMAESLCKRVGGISFEFDF